MNVLAVMPRRVGPLVFDEVVLDWWYSAGEGGNVAEGLMLEHSGAYSFGELFDLFFDVGEERIRAPAPYEHDGVDWLLGEVHEHGKASAHGVKPNVVGCESKDGLSDA